MIEIANQEDAPRESIHLGMLKIGERAIVVGLADSNAADHLSLKTRLLELGFAEGEPVRVVAESFPKRDPMAIRLGNTTFALRRREAALVQVARIASNHSRQAGKQ